MKLSRPLKIIIAVASLWPLVYMFLFFAFLMSSAFFLSSADSAGNGFPIAFELIFAVHAATILFTFALCAFYIVYLFKTDRVPQDKKALWAVVLFLGNMMAFPFFWWFYIWPEDEPTNKHLAAGA